MKEQFTQKFEIHVTFGSVDNTKATESINVLLREHAPASKMDIISTESLVIKIPYRSGTDLVDYSPLINKIEEMVSEQQIKSFRVVSSNLENIFNELVIPSAAQKPYSNGHAHNDHTVNKKIEDVSPIVQQEKLSESEVVKSLLTKRFLHFKRNYRLILCMLVLPTLFEVIAMGFMILRPPGEHDIDLRFSRALYSNSTDVYSDELANEIQKGLYGDLTEYCTASGDEFGNICKPFETSEQLFHWVLNTTKDYPTSRYGGISLNGSRSAVWYNNNGYHSMPVFLNELNTANLRNLMKDPGYKITTNNHPLKLDDKELSQSSM